MEVTVGLFGANPAKFRMTADAQNGTVSLNAGGAQIVLQSGIKNRPARTMQTSAPDRRSVDPVCWLCRSILWIRRTHEGCKSFVSRTYEGIKTFLSERPAWLGRLFSRDRRSSGDTRATRKQRELCASLFVQLVPGRASKTITFIQDQLHQQFIAGFEKEKSKQDRNAA
jgi:hypothetical protein